MNEVKSSISIVSPTVPMPTIHMNLACCQKAKGVKAWQLNKDSLHMHRGASALHVYLTTN